MEDEGAGAPSKGAPAVSVANSRETAQLPTFCCLRETEVAATTPGVACLPLESEPAPAPVTTSAMDSPAEAQWER